ncbi:hypothetical protein [Arthrobacter oryzae]|uniref:hypothetical protein n=1 Tax=Arthrobacter oryzae TaxID=409290 RepID=UPI00286384F4|nr:hypothetical protein [Arthrobacter oryzae]MDR6508072.1 hypothetical protein [Arthrobacter oryzae]
MSTLSDQAEPAVAALLESDEEQLYEQLGLITKAIETDPIVAGSFGPKVTYDGEAMGPLDALRDLGVRIWKRWEKEAYGLVCGDGELDKKDRESILTAFGFGGVAVASYMAATLVTGFGIAPAIAAVVVAIVIKRFLRPTADEFCAVWKENLS